MRTIVILMSVPKCLVRGTQVTLQPSVWSACLGVGGTMYGHGSIASGLRRTGGICGLEGSAQFSLSYFSFGQPGSGGQEGEQQQVWVEECSDRVWVCVC